jgi:rhodanese-related sulfurtransferase
MMNLDFLLTQAEARRRERRLPYRGALLPEEAWALLQCHSGTKLVDIRSEAERVLVGRIPGAVEIEMKRFPEWTPHPHFEVICRKRLNPDEWLLFICRSGARSDEAARRLTALGYAHCFNVLEGFEGDKNDRSQRQLNGWKVKGLPWFQV